MDNRIVWLRRDLRLTDHPALAAASAADEPERRIVPLFVLDPALLRSRRMSPARLSYLCDALADLDGSLRSRGGRLVLREGDPTVVVPAVAAEVRATHVHLSGDVSPYAQRRDAEVSRRLAEQGVAVMVHNSTFVQPPGRVRAQSGEMYRVFSPFQRAWAGLAVGTPLAAPDEVAVEGSVPSEQLPTLDSLGVDLLADVIHGGETEAKRRLDVFLDEWSERYDGARDRMGEAATSRLSADLHYGCVSPRAVLSRLDRRKPGHKAFATELAWRDFYAHVMHAWPQVRTSEFNPALRTLPWRGEGEAFTAWTQGRTGYPIVDAGMRQLLAEGWMHNRARMITASFLCKDLLVDWRLGETHFLRHLVDGDLASNNGGWQWAAGTGTDAQPYFRICAHRPRLPGADRRSRPSPAASAGLVRRTSPHLSVRPVVQAKGGSGQGEAREAQPRRGALGTDLSHHVQRTLGQHAGGDPGVDAGIGGHVTRGALQQRHRAAVVAPLGVTAPHRHLGHALPVVAVGLVDQVGLPDVLQKLVRLEEALGVEQSRGRGQRLLQPVDNVGRIRAIW